MTEGKYSLFLGVIWGVEAICNSLHVTWLWHSNSFFKVGLKVRSHHRTWPCGCHGLTQGHGPPAALLGPLDSQEPLQSAQDPSSKGLRQRSLAVCLLKHPTWTWWAPMGTAGVASRAHFTASVSLPVPVSAVRAYPDGPDSRRPAGQKKKKESCGTFPLLLLSAYGVLRRFRSSRVKNKKWHYLRRYNSEP